MIDDIVAELQRVARKTRDAAGQELLLLSLVDLESASRAYGLSLREMEVLALENHLLPARYQRNLGTVGWEGQRKLLRATVAIIGAGGLGGWIIDGLARMGVGKLIIIDADVFEENNLNRQLLAVESSLGKPKIELARAHVAEVNAATEVVAHRVWASAENFAELIAGAEVAVDALDTLPARLDLQRAAAAMGIPFVHGAIAGYIGQVMTVFPGDGGLFALYGTEDVPQRGIETRWGNPAGTPMMVAAWQIHEVVKLITGRGELLRHRLLIMDAESGTTDLLPLGKG
jgi:molybdopterin/thiamine biosynthesis adenylyltransferase